MVSDIVEKDWGAIRNSDWKWMVDKVKKQSDKIERLRAALESIAKNTCCDKCQEAALVAREALENDNGH